MLLLKLAILTCVFYLGITIALEGVVLLVARLKGGLAYWGTPGGWAAFFAAIWLISYISAWLIVRTCIRRP